MQLLIALRFYASGSFLQVIGDTFGIDKSTVSRTITDVTNVLVRKKDIFINWPTELADINRIRDAFHQVARFPRVIGCIDCTHIQIQAPNVDEFAYVNRKGYHSINVQAVCDNSGNAHKIFDVNQRLVHL